jgi:hypothetical protein
LRHSQARAAWPGPEKQEARLPSKVFLSWSGRDSQRYAAEWRRWIKKVFPDARVFLSSSDIRAGADWRREVSKNIRQSKVGIVFVDSKNSTSPWIVFEAGALAIAKRRRLVICILPGTSAKLPSPLAGFQAVKADERGSKKIFDELKAAVGKPAAKFSLVWPSLEQRLRIQNR